MKKSILLLTTILLSILMLCGCKKEPEMKLYYLSTDELSLVECDYDLYEKDRESQVDEVLAKLSESPDDTKYTKLIPGGLTIKEVAVDLDKVTITFGNEYYDLDNTKEVLLRCGVVKSLLQLDGVKTVSFIVGEKPLSINGNVIGAMDENQFLDILGEDTESLQKIKISLYYATADGSGLIKEENEIYYNTNTQLEKVVLDSLIKKPDNENAIVAIPSNTKINSITTTDGICYVNLDSSFLNGVPEVSEQVMIYSIVNSLTSLDGISKVQISINGENNGITLNSGAELSEIYEFNEALVKQDSIENLSDAITPVAD